MNQGAEQLSNYPFIRERVLVTDLEDTLIPMLSRGLLCNIK